MTLDSVIGSFSDGASAEQIVQQFPTLALADVYAVIAYYLRSPQEVERYLEKRREQASETRAANTAKFDPQGVRDCMMARQEQGSLAQWFRFADTCRSDRTVPPL